MAREGVAIGVERVELVEDVEQDADETAPPTAASGASERVPSQKAIAAIGSRVTKM